MTRSFWMFVALIILPAIALAGPSDAPRKSAFEKALSVILATAAPQRSQKVRETIIRDYEDARANKGEAIELLSGSTWRSTNQEDQTAAGDHALEGCQLRYGKPCALIALNEEIVAEGELVSKDMPRLHYSGTYDPQQIPIIKSALRELPKNTRLRQGRRAQSHGDTSVGDHLRLTGQN